MERALEYSVSILPSNALSHALTPLTGASQEAARARHVQALKNSHHSEDVEALDDTAVDSVRDESQGRGNRQDQQKRDDTPEERLDLQSLAPPPPSTAVPAPPPSRTPDGATASHLDISA
jgi:hypothetical protein